MFIAPLAFGAIVSTVTHYTERIFNDQFVRQAADATKFMTKRRVPKELQKRVVRNLKSQVHHEQHITCVVQLLAKLSPAVQRELSLELLRSVILRFPLFRNAPRGFIAEVAHAHHWVQCFPGDLVVEEGQVEEEVVFVIHGRLLMTSAKDEDSDSSNSAPDEEELDSGTWFGEACLFEEKVPRKFTVYAVSDSELAVLAFRDYHRICNSNPEMFRHHQFVAQAIQEKKIDISRLGYKVRMNSNGSESTGSRRSSIISLV
jgi:CRP-like cAMP-binding protein